MKRTIIGMILFFTMAGTSALAAPHLECTNRVFEFGSVSEIDQVEHVFVLRNTGDSDLVISKVRTCCGGTADLQNPVIQPGGETSLRAKLSFKNREGDVRKAWYVLSNDPDWPFFKLSLEGTVLGAATNNHHRGTEDTEDQASQQRDNLTTQEPFPSQELSTTHGALRTPVRLDFFYEAGCADCRVVRELVIPALAQRFAGQYELRSHDVGIMSNVIMLVAYQEALRITEDESVCMIVDYRHVFNGLAAIESGLVARVEACIAERNQPGWNPPKPVSVTVNADSGLKLAEHRLRSFTLPAVALAGLIDGLNPCAIGTLVFFMSLLAVSKVRGRTLLMVGLVFCTASFITYTAIGFGLLRFLHAFAGFPIIQRSVELLMTLVLLAFAFLSFRDAHRFRRSQNPDDVSLQLPAGVKNSIHSLLRAGLGTGHLIAGTFVTGAAVTALESVCTGQVYVPTLVLVIKTGCTQGQGALPPIASAAGGLLLYNAMFIVPLVIAFIVAYRGFTTDRWITWSRRQVVPSKLLLGLLFAVLAVLMWVM